MKFAAKWKLFVWPIGLTLCLLVVMVLLLPPVGASQYCYSLHDALRSPESVKKLALLHKGLAEVPQEIEQLTNLTSLQLFGNKINHLPVWMTRNSKLVLISLDNNQFSTFPSGLTEMSNLRELTLGNNAIVELPPSIGNLSLLTSLELSDNRLKSVPPEIGYLKALRRLDLGKNLLEELPPEIGDLSSLESLSLEGNRLTRLPPQIGKLQRLGILTLENNRLIDIPEEISRLVALKKLRVGGNCLSPKAQEKLRQLLPHTNIDFGRQQPLFIEDLNALESTTVTVRQPANVTCMENGMGSLKSEGIYMSSELDGESKASAYRLLKEAMAKYPLKQSFRSIQDDWLLTFFYSISYSRVIDGKKTRIFKVDFYNILTPPPVMEIKHKLGGRAVYHDRDIESKIYMFFAQSIESEYPDTAKALREIAKKAREN